MIREYNVTLMAGSIACAAFLSILLLLVWLSGNALVLLVGASINIVVGGHHADDPNRDHGDESDITEAVRVSSAPLREPPGATQPFGEPP
ncbi:hypothetical protein [Natronococcus occultus]|uniref:Uncharacterized protein n=1 Tax=Natronococcus occultus SP4 TaxID=694430 RepID=L0JY42_9EURY|nr:hypothetical protein [Natronococcus occultus]AGB37957.1 hypothetical protein Natoc_2175 [Natronococcus occultus SP4]